MDGGKKKCCNRETCPLYRAYQERSDEKAQQQTIATKSPPAIPTGRNSTQILFVEPNFTETPSEYEVFYDCISSEYDTPSLGSSLCSSVCPKRNETNKLGKDADDSMEFRGSLQRIMSTTRRLLKYFDEAGQRDHRGRRCDPECFVSGQSGTHSRTTHVEMTARVGSGGSGGSGAFIQGREVHLDQYTLRIEPLTFKVPLQIKVTSGHSCKPPHTCHVSTMIQQTCQLAPNSTLEPIRTATITATTGQTMGPPPDHKLLSILAPSELTYQGPPPVNNCQEPATGNADKQSQTDSDQYNRNINYESNLQLDEIPNTKITNTSNPDFLTDITEKFDHTDQVFVHKHETFSQTNIIQSEGNFRQDFDIQQLQLQEQILPIQLLHGTAAATPSVLSNQPGPTAPNAMVYPIDYRCTRGDAPYNQALSTSVAPVPASEYMNTMDQQLYSVEMVNPACMCQAPYHAPYLEANTNTNGNPKSIPNPMVMASSKSCGSKCACRSSNRSPPKLERISPTHTHTMNEFQEQHSNRSPSKLEWISPIHEPQERAMNRCHCQSEDEYFSLSSSDRDEPGPSHLFNYSGLKTETKIDISNSPEHMIRTSEARNALILQLLQEIVHLIDENESFCGPDTYTGNLSPGRMHKISATNEPRSDNGPFTSSIKITFCPSRKGASKISQDTEPTELTQAAAISNMPCNLFITPCSCPQHPFYMTPLSGQHTLFPPPTYPSISNTNQTMPSWKPCVETINYPMEKAINMGAPNQEFMGDVISSDFIRPDERRHSENIPLRLSIEQNKYETDMDISMPSVEPQYDDEFRRATGSVQQEFKHRTGSGQQDFQRPTDSVQQKFQRPSGSMQQDFKRPTGSVQQEFKRPTDSVQQELPQGEQNYEQSAVTEHKSLYLNKTSYEGSDFEETQYDEKHFRGSHFEEQQHAQPQYEEQQHRHSSHFTQNEEGQAFSYGEDNLRTANEQETVFGGDEQTPHIQVRNDLYDSAEGKPERISFAEEIGTDSFIGDDSDIFCEENDEICKEQQALRRAARRKSKKHDDCDCCHCRAVRENNLECMTIATPEQAKMNPAELKFFIDSILMDLEAMEHARRKKQIEQNTCPPKRCAIGERVSFPVTITEVTDLGASSLFVKWCIHDCFGIGGYEIYVDGYLTNRYFHCNHEAAVVCDVDVTKTHKIVLVAQPRTDDLTDGQSKCNALLRKSDVDNGPSALWTPSIYLYEPSQLREPDPIIRLSI